MSLTLPKEDPCDTRCASPDTEASAKPQLYLHCAQLLFHVLYTIIPFPCIGWKPILLHLASAVFQVHPPLLIPCA